MFPAYEIISMVMIPESTISPSPLSLLLCPQLWRYLSQILDLPSPFFFFLPAEIRRKYHNKKQSIPNPTTLQTTLHYTKKNTRSPLPLNVLKTHKIPPPTKNPSAHHQKNTSKHHSPTPRQAKNHTKNTTAQTQKKGSSRGQCRSQDGAWVG